MVTVAFIGPDGAGKTTICKRLEQSLGLPCKSVYMGINLNASTLMLPTTRLLLQARRLLGIRPEMAGPRNPDVKKPRPRGLVRKTAAAVKSGLRLANQLGEEWFRQAVAWYYTRRGYVVLFDRHFFGDYYATDVAAVDPRRPICSRIHGFMLNRLYPKPDLVIFLDAPATVLYARKGEGTLEYLERRRSDYRNLRRIVNDFVTVDATLSLDELTADVAKIIRRYSKDRTVPAQADCVASPAGY